MSKEQNSYSEKCFSEEVIDENCFVGIHFKDGNFDIKYPLGYRISEDEKENKKDIINLIKVLHHYGKTENENNLVPLGKTTEDWYDEEIIKQNEYLQIRAIRLDTKSLMYNHSVANDETLSFLADLIKTM